MTQNLNIRHAAMESGKAAIIALVALVIVAAGAMAYLSTSMMGGESAGADKAAVQTAAGDEAAAPKDAAPASTDAAKPAEQAAAETKPDAAPAADSETGAVIEPGNPVVARVDGKDVTRADVINFIQTLGPQVRQMPLNQLFPLATQQVINAQLIGEKVKGANLDNDPIVQEQMKLAKDQIIRSVYMQKEAEKAVTEDMLKAAYDNYKKNFKPVDEVKARHILVKDEAQANDVLKQLKDGKAFADLAKQYSIDGTKDRGGELNYFSKQDVVPEFAEAAFALEKGKVTEKPVKSDFGYHIIETLDKRQRPPAEYEQAKPALANELRGQALSGIVEKWRKDAKLELFDINGKPIKVSEDAMKPAAGDDKAEPKADAAKAQ